MTPVEQAALRVAVLDAIKAAADDEMAEARADAEAEFKAATAGFRASTGALQVDITLPGGDVIGHLSVKAGAKSSETDETGLHEWAAERNPEALEPYVLPGAGTDQGVTDLLFEKCPDLFSLQLRPGALEDPRALDLITSVFPAWVSSRVRASALRAYVREAAKAEENAPKGWLFDPGTGERLHLVKESQEPPTGAFAFVGAETPERRRQVMAALAAGDPLVRSIAFGAVGAIAPAPEGGEPGD